MNILQLDSSALGTVSVSRPLTAAVVSALRQADPAATVTRRDLAATPLAHLDGALLQALRPEPGSTPEHAPEVRVELALTNTLIEELLAADVIVVGAPMYNFSVPSTLKAWIDRIAQAGRTFRYTASGPQGLVGGKRVVIVSSRGGPMAGKPHETAMDHQEAYLKAVFAFLGITDVTVIRAEGLAVSPEARAAAIDAALAHASRYGAEALAEAA